MIDLLDNLQEGLPAIPMPSLTGLNWRIATMSIPL